MAAGPLRRPGNGTLAERSVIVVDAASERRGPGPARPTPCVWAPSYFESLIRIVCLWVV